MRVKKRSHNVTNSRKTRTRHGIFSKLINHQRDVIYVLVFANFEHILQSPVFISWVKVLFPIFSVNNYLFKVNNRNTRIMCEIWTPEQRYVAIKTPERNAGGVATSQKNLS